MSREWSALLVTVASVAAARLIITLSGETSESVDHALLVIILYHVIRGGRA